MNIYEELVNDLEGIELKGVEFIEKTEGNIKCILWYHCPFTTVDSLSSEIQYYPNIIKENKLKYDTKINAIKSEIINLVNHSDEMIKYYKSEELFGIEEKLEIERYNEIANVMREWIKKHNL